MIALLQTPNRSGGNHAKPSNIQSFRLDLHFYYNEMQNFQELIRQEQEIKILFF